MIEKEQLINELLSDIMEKRITITEEESARLNPIRWPAIKITEDWGRRTSADRRVIELIAKGIKGTTVKEKVSNLQSFIDAALTNDVSKKYTAAEILSKLMFLEIFRSIVVEFGPSVAGFLFEALLAGTSEGEQLADPVDGSLPITDVILGNKPETEEDARQLSYSLKVLSKNGVCKGSFRSLVNFFAPGEESEQTEDKITYLIVSKETADKNKDELLLRFYEFDITRDNFLEWIGHKNVKDREVATPYEYRPGQELDNWLTRDGIKVNSDFIRKKLEVIKTGRPSDLFSSRMLRQHNPEGPRTYKITKGVKLAPAEVLSGEHEDNVIPVGTILDPELEYVLLQRGEESTFLVTGPMVKAGIQNQEGKYLNKGDKLDEDQVYIMQIRQGVKEERSSDTKEYQNLYHNILGDDPDKLNPNDPQFFETLKRSAGYLKKSQWHISADYYRRRASILGELSLSRQHIDKAAWTYVYSLRGEVRKIYNALTSLIENINLYFLGDNQKAGMDAVKNSAEVNKQTRVAVGLDRQFTAREPFFDKLPTDKPYVTETKKPLKVSVDSIVGALLRDFL